MSTFQGSPSFDERFASETLVYKALARYISYDLRVAMPAIINSFDEVAQTAVVQIAIREQIKINNKWVNQNFDVIPDVPIVMPRAGGFTLTMPVTAGDECILLVTDRCLNAWWANGGVQNQEVNRAHDYSDVVAILGPWSQPNVLPNYSTTSTQLRNDEGTAYVEVTDTGVNLVGTLEISGLPATTAPAYPTSSLPINIGGVTYYLQLKSTP